MVQSGLSYSCFRETLILRLSIQRIICIVNIKKSEKLDRDRIEKSMVPLFKWKSDFENTFGAKSIFLFHSLLFSYYLHECMISRPSTFPYYFFFVCMKPDVNRDVLQQRTQHLSDMWGLKIRVRVCSKQSTTFKKYFWENKKKLN